MRIGEVELTISTSRVAALFHAVDQLSRWSPFTHEQYSKWAPPSEDVEAKSLLDAHAALRKKRGWGGGYERTLYLTSSDPRAALERAAKSGVISQEEADQEARILTAFEPRLATKLDAGGARIERLREHLEREKTAFARLAVAWLAVLGLPAPPDPIPMVFVPSPGGGAGGGGANGGVVVIEVPEHGTPYATLTTVAHELAHALAAPKRSALDALARRCGHGLDQTMVGEALAYAIAPGSFAYGSSVGALDKMVDRTEPKSQYGQFARLARAIQPQVESALRTQRRNALPELLDAICAAAAAGN